MTKSFVDMTREELLSFVNTIHVKLITCEDGGDFLSWLIEQLGVDKSLFTQNDDETQDAEGT